MGSPDAETGPQMPRRGTVGPPPRWHLDMLVIRCSRSATRQKLLADSPAPNRGQRTQSQGQDRLLAREHPPLVPASFCRLHRAAESFGAYSVRRAGGAGGPVTTENLAIVFTDIVGSTELSQRLSISADEEVRRRHFSILRQAVAETGGTEVKNLGDGIMVVFGSASAALGCAVAMQQGVESENRKGKVTVGLRIGLSGGEVSPEDNDFFGDPVVEAARLCAKCEGGQVLASRVADADGRSAESS